MMSFALMGCMIIGASDASAQGRSRSQGGSSSSRSQSAAVSRSSSHSTAPTVSRSSSTTSRSSATAPQVSRSSSTTSRSSAGVSHSTTTAPQMSRSSGGASRSTTTTAPQVSRRSSSTSRATTTPPQVRDNSGNRPGTGTTRGTGSSVTRHSDSTPHVAPQSPSTRDRSATTGTMSRRDRDGNRTGGNMGNDNRGRDNKDNGGNKGNDRHDNKGNRPSGNRPSGNNPGGNHGNHSGNNPGGNHGNHSGNHGYNPNNRFDYGSHHYRDQFNWNHSHHNWSRPLPPPVRAHRPAPLIWRRPVIPAGWHPYAGAPVIDRILGLMFGTLYEASLDQLYYNGYYIDGYADNIIYLRDVPMLNLYWPDVMLSYEYGKLANAQFVYHSSYYDRARFDRAYNSLCRIYGPPVYSDGMTISWYGGNRTGWVTLTMNDSYGDYYTTMSIGY